MSHDYKSDCGCVIHVIQWTSRRKVVSQQSCPLHKHATEMLLVLKSALDWLDRRDNAEFSYAVRPEDVKAWREAIAKAEGKII